MTRCARTPHLQGNGLRATARRFRTGNPGRHSERKGINPVNARVGLALKENCPGLCNNPRGGHRASAAGLQRPRGRA